MRISEMLYAIASWLESPDNEVLLLAEYDNECLKVAVESCIEAAFILKNAAEKVDNIEPPEESNITAESLDGLAQIASAFDTSGNLELKKQASVIDELLLTIASPPNIFAERKDLEDNRLEELKKRYQQPRKELEKINKIVDSVNAIEKSDFMKDRKIIETSLNTRTCPDHPGAQMARKDDCWQCELDKKTYNYQTGFTLNNGTRVPGGDVANQTVFVSTPYHAIFDTREDRLQTNKP